MAVIDNLVRFQRCKNCEHRLAFDNVVTDCLMSCFYGPRCTGAGRWLMMWNWTWWLIVTLSWSLVKGVKNVLPTPHSTLSTIYPGLLTLMTPRYQPISSNSSSSSSSSSISTVCPKNTNPHFCIPLWSIYDFNNFWPATTRRNLKFHRWL